MKLRESSDLETMRFFGSTSLWIFIFILTNSTFVHAEYRAFLLRISKRSSPQDFRLKTSNLDPVQYMGYFPAQPDELVTYDDSWLCSGRTGDFKNICPNPRAPVSDSQSSPNNGPEINPKAP